ncbi:MAG TPA: sigma-70 family RNA polymerase sigma factor [Acetobacteraceae bacterium]|nr:sigma-70 family RNA polymerase sigma factor [Acetobacteraceae bacterium]
MADEMRAALIGLLPRLRRFGLALTGSPADADELVRATYESAMRRERHFRRGSRLDVCLYTIMHNQWTDQLKWRRIRPRDGLGTGTKNGEPTAAAAPAALAAARDALATLPAEQRSALFLVCVDRLSYAEAAEVLGVARGTLMSRLSRGRQELHAAVTGRAEADPANVHPLSPEDRSCPCQD